MLVFLVFCSYEGDFTYVFTWVSFQVTKSFDINIEFTWYFLGLVNTLNLQENQFGYSPGHDLLYHPNHSRTSLDSPVFMFCFRSWIKLKSCSNASRRLNEMFREFRLSSPIRRRAGCQGNSNVKLYGDESLIEGLRENQRNSRGKAIVKAGLLPLHCLRCPSHGLISCYLRSRATNFTSCS